MNRVYWSKNHDPYEWPEGVKTFYFPFAEKVMRYSLGRKLVLLYLRIRLVFGGGE